MNNNNNHFSDVRDHVEGHGVGFGVFGGGGADHVFTVDSSGISQEGPIIECSCHNCGNRLNWVPSWTEVAIVSQKLAPRDDQTGVSWVYDPQQQAFRFPTHCGSCNKEVKVLHMQPAEAETYLRRGVQANAVSKGFLDQVIAGIRARMGHQGR